MSEDEIIENINWISKLYIKSKENKNMEETNKFKIGQKVKIIRTGKIGEIKDILFKEFDDYGSSNKCYVVNNIWYTVHDLEEVQEILNDKEKDYLDNIIKPFRNRVKYITKDRGLGVELDYICIVMESKYSSYGDEEAIEFPYFESNTMYKGMEVGKEYTLEELGL